MGNESETEVELFLTKVKTLIQIGQRHFVRRKSRNVEQDLLDLGLSSTKELWNSIMELQVIESYKPPELDLNGSGEKVFFFQKIMPNGIIAYIKLKVKINKNGELCVCLSFHPTTYII